jgi:hypothetical protein
VIRVPSAMHFVRPFKDSGGLHPSAQTTRLRSGLIGSQRDGSPLPWPWGVLVQAKRSRALFERASKDVAQERDQGERLSQGSRVVKEKGSPPGLLIVAL